ncbi:hypothetical protein [Polyangium aurulentum]|uniref:hypothetical protein n=1 Tax=Polyangium aurulentum TaxID=2567896 RepID=UPI0010ADFA15|nr:hypothetical protein [Polyangium aurulentum]UQA55441.1 hypothetical protein E8A73_029340 [Polyangium aurulentum]
MDLTRRSHVDTEERRAALMALRVTWDKSILLRREQIHWEVVAAIEADVLAFAETMTGDADIGQGYRPKVLLRAAHGYTLKMRVDLFEKTLYVYGMSAPRGR